MSRHFISCILFAAVFLFSSCHLALRPETIDLCILYTTDTHSLVFPYDFHHDKEGSACLCNFATLVEDQRAIYGNRCLVFDNGNKLSGGPTAYYYKFADTSSEPICYRVERLIGYNGVGIGENDIEIPECLNPTRHDNALQPPTLCANLLYRQTGKPVFQPYKVYDCDNVKVAVLGMMTPISGDWLPRELWNQYETQDMIECARQWIPIIRETENPDIIVGLFSCSNQYHQDNECDIDTYKNPAGGIPTAIRVPGFDLILLGNSSNEIVGYVDNDQQDRVVYIQAGSNCQKAGMARIHLEKRRDGTYSKRIFSSLIDLEQYAPQADLLQQLHTASDSIYLYFNRPIGYLHDDLVGTEGIFGPDKYRNFINTVQLWYTKADISLANVIIPHDTIQSGNLNMRNIFDIYPIHHQLQKLTMTGEEVRRYLEWGASCQFETMQKDSDPLLLLKKDPYGHVVYNTLGQPTLRFKPTNFVSAGGIRYSIDISKPEGERVSILSWADGSPFDPRGLYLVVLNSEQLRDEGQFISRGLNWDREELSLHAVPTKHNSMRQILFEYIQAFDTIKADNQANWEIIPHMFWQEAHDREVADLDPIW